MACNSYNNQIYWFNSRDSNTVDNSNLYHANQRGKGSAALLVTGVDTPSDLFKDANDDKVFYVTKMSNVFEYELPPIEEDNKIAEGFGSITGLVHNQDQVFIADNRVGVY